MSPRPRKSRRRNPPPAWLHARARVAGQLRSAAPGPSQGVVPPEFADAARGVRLQKALAAAGVASRRAAEELIQHGRVTVNGQLVTGLPAWVDPASDQIAVDGRSVARPHRPRPALRHLPPGRQPASTTGRVYVLLHKPRSTVTTTDDPQGRQIVTDLIPPQAFPGRRLFPVGRLDADSAGLLLLTDDGDLAHRLTHPRFHVPKVYTVSVRGRVEEDHVQQLQRGLVLAQRTVAGRDADIRKVRLDQVKLLGRQHDRERGDRTLLEVTLHSGHNRVIRRALAKLGFKVRRLTRTAVGPLRLRGLAAGQWRELTLPEVQHLRRDVGLGRPGP